MEKEDQDYGNWVEVCHWLCFCRRSNQRGRHFLVCKKPYQKMHFKIEQKSMEQITNLSLSFIHSFASYPQQIGSFTYGIVYRFLCS